MNDPRDELIATLVGALSLAWDYVDTGGPWSDWVAVREAIRQARDAYEAHQIQSHAEDDRPPGPDGCYADMVNVPCTKRCDWCTPQFLAGWEAGQERLAAQHQREGEKIDTVKDWLHTIPVHFTELVSPGAFYAHPSMRNGPEEAAKAAEQFQTLMEIMRRNPPSDNAKACKANCDGAYHADDCAGAHTKTAKADTEE